MIKERLLKSIEQYRSIIEHAKQLDQLLVQGEPEKLQAYIVKMQNLQTEAGLDDGKLVEEISGDLAGWQTHPLFRERLQLLKQIVEMNDLLLPRIRAMMSVTAAELAQVRDGRVAVAGYHPAASRLSRGSSRGVG